MLHPREDYARIQDPAGLIPENEPVFILRAQDKVAARVVRNWAALNDDAGGDPKLSLMAREHADKMEAWPVKKLADLPAEQNEAQARAAAAAERVAEPEQPAKLASQADIENLQQEVTGLGEDIENLASYPESRQEPESKAGSGVISTPKQAESKPDAGVVSGPEKSQNKDGSGVS